MALNANEKLVFEFFEKIARFECAMKFGRFCRKGSNGIAEPDWKGLIKEAGPKLSKFDSADVAKAMEYLTTCPPKVQVYDDGRASFQAQALDGADKGSQSLAAAKRVRNNLFHGGKHTGHKDEEERNDELLRHAALVIDKAAELIGDGFYYDYRKLA